MPLYIVEMFDANDANAFDLYVEADSPEQARAQAKDDWPWLSAGTATVDS